MWVSVGAYPQTQTGLSRIGPKLRFGAQVGPLKAYWTSPIIGPLSGTYSNNDFILYGMGSFTSVFISRDYEDYMIL